MELIRKFTISIIPSMLSICFLGCNSWQKDDKTVSDKIENSTKPKNSFELANDYIAKLRNDKVDTIVFYKRTCINCCDFYNIIWTSKGKAVLKKFPFNTDSTTTQSDIIKIKDNKIFNELHEYYLALKNSNIKPNEHKLKNGNGVTIMMDHYCYTLINIFVLNDTIQSVAMKDHDFEKYIDYNQSKKGQTNDNYEYNVNSKWNAFLITIEEQLANMKETQPRELETLRARKK